MADSRSYKKHPKVFGIVGLPGSGKDYFCYKIIPKTFDEKCKVIDSDKITHEVLIECSEQIRETVGDMVFSDNGKLDRKKLAEVLFNDQKKMKKHLIVVNPKIQKKVLHRLQNIPNSTRVFINSPFLFEYGWDNHCDEIWLIYASFETRLERVKSRGWDKSELERRDSKFMAIEELRKKCDRVIVNEGNDKNA